MNAWKLWNAIHAKSGSYICRVRDKINYEIIESKVLTPADIEAGVNSDQTIRVIVKGSKIKYLRDDLLLHERVGEPWGVGGTHRKNETLVFLGALRFKRTESVRY